MGNAPSCNPRSAADWLADGCSFGNPTGITVFGLGAHSRVTPTTSCEVTCPTDGGDFVVASARGVLGCCVVRSSEAFNTHHKRNPFCSSGLTAVTDANIQAAVNAWVIAPAATEAMYGHIKWWDTGAVTDMTNLFENTAGSQHPKATFQEDLAHW